ncbi:MAG: hypothetical protein J0L86_07740 [Flavobacteriales bacterium]|nr:hypothetical protein [Flavobacteriales bacterium]
MELVRIEQLIDKYFEGQTSIAEERELKAYFSSSDVAQHLEQYRDVFGYFTQAKEHQFTKSVPLQPRKQFNVLWLSIAASIVIVFGVVTFRFLETEAVQPAGELGTYDNPELAMAETQKALDLVSEKLNVGIESVSYINEYESTKNKIFKK